jgi:hypothetical protein
MRKIIILNLQVKDCEIGGTGSAQWKRREMGGIFNERFELLDVDV